MSELDADRMGVRQWRDKLLVKEYGFYTIGL